MKAADLKEWILSIVQDIVFVYNGKNACINPCSEHEFIVGFGDFSRIYDNIDDVMSEPIYDGNSLNEICDTLEFE